MTNSDPEHEVNDRPAPEFRAFVTPNSNTRKNQVDDIRAEHDQQEIGNAERDIPGPRRLFLFGNTSNHIGNARVVQPAHDERSSLGGILDSVVHKLINSSSHKSFP